MTTSTLTPATDVGTLPARRRHRRRRDAVAVAIAVIAVFAAFAVSLMVGSNAIAPGDVLAALFGGAATPEATVILTQRLPRTVLGLAVGLALGAAGALMQGHTRNPLAEPGLFGVNSGAALGVVVLTFAFDRSGPLEIVGAALVGAAAATIVVVSLAWGGGPGGRTDASPLTLTVAGAALGAVLTALTTAVVLLDRQSLDVVRYWAVGSLSGRPTEAVPLVLALIAVGLVLALVNAPGVTALGLGDDVARSLGNIVAAVRIVGVVAITVLAAAATAVCGPIAFLGIAAPWAVRWVSGPRYGVLVPLAALAGGVILLLSDVLGRISTRDGELPVGLVVAIVAAPVMIAIVTRKKGATL